MEDPRGKIKPPTAYFCRRTCFRLHSRRKGEPAAETTAQSEAGQEALLGRIDPVAALRSLTHTQLLMTRKEDKAVETVKAQAETEE
jgi:hypothetical protein